MTQQDFACEKCTWAQTNGAVCALHGIETERRRSTSELVSELEKTVKVFVQFMYIMTGVALLGTLVIASSFVYTSKLESRVELVASETYRISSTQAVTEDRYIRIYQQLDKIVASIEKLTEKQAQVDGWGPK